MDLDMNLIIHECQFVVHKCKEGGQLYLQPEHPDTSVFTSPNFDNKDVAETLMNHIDTASMSEFRDGLSKYSTRYDNICRLIVLNLFAALLILASDYKLLLYIFYSL